MLCPHVSAFVRFWAPTYLYDLIFMVYIVVYTHTYVLSDWPMHVYLAISCYVPSAIRLYTCVGAHTHVHVYGSFPRIGIRMLELVLVHSTICFTYIEVLMFFFNAPLTVIAMYMCFIYRYMHHLHAVPLRILVNIGILFVLILYIYCACIFLLILGLLG